MPAGRDREICIRNVVASATFNHMFDVNAIAKSFQNAGFRGGFPGVVFRLKRPKTTLLIFRTGKVVCTGARSESEARRGILTAIKELRKGGIVMGREEPKIRIENIVATVNLNCDVVDLQALSESMNRLSGRVLYEPEQFPAMMYQMKNLHMTFLIFSSGKIVCLGAKREKDIYEAIKKLKHTLREKGVEWEKR